MQGEGGGGEGAQITTEAVATLERRGGWSIALVSLSGVVNLVSALHLAADVEGYDEGAPLVLSLGVTSLLLFVATAVAFLRWLHRAVACAHALSPPPTALNVGPGWAVLSFFVPIANLWRPYQTVSRLSIAADPLALPEPAAEPPPGPPGEYRASARPAERRPAGEGRWPEGAPVGAWWAAWLGASFLGRVAFYNETREAPAASILGDVATAAAACLLVLVVRSITLRLREMARRRAVPLPPRPFYG